MSTYSIHPLPLPVSTHSIRYRILKESMIVLPNISQLSFNPFDPIQDTESQRLCCGRPRWSSFNPFDPIQDTERRGAFSYPG